MQKACEKDGKKDAKRMLKGYQKDAKRNGCQKDAKMIPKGCQQDAKRIPKGSQKRVHGASKAAARALAATPNKRDHRHDGRGGAEFQWLGYSPGLLSGASCAKMVPASLRQ